MKNLISSLIIIFATTLSISCQNRSSDSAITMIDSEEMKTLLENKAIQLVDVRTIEEFNEHYIKGAENIVYDANFEQKLILLEKDKPVIVYCRSGRRSAISADIMEKQGFTDIYELEGGIIQWMNEGNPIKKVD